MNPLDTTPCERCGVLPPPGTTHRSLTARGLLLCLACAWDGLAPDCGPGHHDYRGAGMGYWKCLRCVNSLAPTPLTAPKEPKADHSSDD